MNIGVNVSYFFVFRCEFFSKTGVTFFLWVLSGPHIHFFFKYLDDVDVSRCMPGAAGPASAAAPLRPQHSVLN